MIEESYDTKTFVFGWNEEVRPGQFVMVWVPGLDEIPMSVSGINARTKSITVKAIGEATRKIHELGVGDRIRIRGPYGNGFDLSRGEMLVVGGGVGTAAVIPAIVQSGADAIIAARTKDDVIMDDLASAFLGCNGR